MSKKVKADAAPCVPQSRTEMVEFIAEIGTLQRERERIQTRMNDELASIRTGFETEAEPLNKRIADLSRGVQLWCEVNRDELTRNGKTKTVGLPSGEVKWRTRPAKVMVRAAEVVIETLKSLGLDRFVRVKEEVNKEAILADPAAVGGVKGITITQGEDFVIVPHETELEEVAA